LTIKLTLDITTKCNFALTSAPRRILAARRDLQLVLPINIQLSKNFAGSRSGLRIGPTRHRTTETIRQFARSTSTKCNVRTVGEYSFSALPRFSAAERLQRMVGLGRLELPTSPLSGVRALFRRLRAA